MLRISYLYKYLITSLSVSITFAIIESVWRFPEDYTTPEQFFLNFVWSPVMIHGYEMLIKNRYLKIILFPVNVWITEILMGVFMKEIIGYRIWEYTDAMALVDNHITLSYYFHWFAIGILVAWFYGW